MIRVAIRNLRVRYGETAAVDRVDLEVLPQELFLLLGPSGCGKTTVLRSVAGFVTPTEGTIHFGDDDVTRVPPHARNAGMVFQSFALWPHLTVAENVAFGLREQRVPRNEITTRVEAALESTHMRGFGRRRIDELSGGEQQRVAIARALVVRPRCLLLDEPLASLDAKLRRSMREEIRRICKSFGLTTIYVTHDQKEALAIADRVAVMQKGRILQVGTPSDVYRRPRSHAVASFIGETNLVAGRVLSTDAGGIRLDSALGELRAAPEQSVKVAGGDKVWLAIRPESCRLLGDAQGPAPASAGSNVMRGRRTTTVYLGEIAEHLLMVGEQPLSIFELNPAPAAPPASTSTGGGDLVSVRLDPADIVLLPFEAAPAPDSVRP
ncbi:MAG TPA: ABC transporter ATP-binding protein [Polyangia bacterium]|nr:ABC transporter ATP-binding protein [Polyangia bacterium]